MEVIQQLLRQPRPLLNTETMPRVLDLLWSRLGGLNGKFFEAGWGNLGIVNLQQDLEVIKQWPPKDMQIDWKLMQQGSWEGTPYKLFEGSFRTPCVRRIYDALPPESRTGRVQLLLPDGLPGSSNSSSSGVITSHLPLGGSSRQRIVTTTTSSTSSSSSSGGGGGSRRMNDSVLFGDGSCVNAAVLHLAATGDQGFWRRLKLGGPLLSQGVAQLVLESPYYGARRPAEQRGSKLCAVSDLLALGWATIYESLCLLHWLEESGINTRGICGLSMGGVHAAMTAGLCPRPTAVTPLLAPRSAAVAYCDGALAPLMAWGSLLTERDWANNHVEEVVAEASQPVGMFAAARYVALQHQLEQQLAAADASLHDSLEQQQQQQQQLKQQQKQQPSQQGMQQVGSLQHQQQQQQAEAALGSAEEAVAAVQQVAAMAAVAEAAAAEQAVAFHQQQQQLMDQPTSNSSSSSQQPSRATAAAAADWRKQIWRWKRSTNWNSSGSSSSCNSSSSSSTSYTDLGRPGFDPPPPDTFRRLRHVLETYTDVTRYPRPVRSDAAVLVAAKHDVYVDMRSVKALQAHWPGSELRLVSGGHVSAFLMHQDAFRAALRDSLARVAAPPQACVAAAAAAAE